MRGTVKQNLFVGAIVVAIIAVPIFLVVRGDGTRTISERERQELINFVNRETSKIDAIRENAD